MKSSWKKWTEWSTSCVEIINGAETKLNLFPFRCRFRRVRQKRVWKKKQILKLHSTATNVLNFVDYSHNSYDIWDWVLRIAVVTQCQSFDEWTTTAIVPNTKQLLLGNSQVYRVSRVKNLNFNSWRAWNLFCQSNNPPHNCAFAPVWFWLQAFKPFCKHTFHFSFKIFEHKNHVEAFISCPSYVERNQIWFYMQFTLFEWESDVDVFNCYARNCARSLIVLLSSL